MVKSLGAFRVWVTEIAELNWAALISDPEALAWALQAYGMHLFQTGCPRYLLVYAITAAQDQFPACKSFMSVAWQIDRKWQIHEPGKCRPVLPAVALRAAVTLGLLWNWPRWVGIVLLGFAAMLHPAEMIALKRADLILPSDVAHDHCCMFVHIRNPKTARFARRQHGRIDDPLIIALAERLYGPLNLEAHLYAGSASMFRKQWDAVLQRLGIPTRQADGGATPAVLRGSGATLQRTLLG